MIWKSSNFIVYIAVYSIQSNSFYTIVTLALPRLAIGQVFTLLSLCLFCITKSILWIVLDSYVSAIERYRTIKNCLHWDWYTNSCVYEEKKIIQEPSVVYSYIGGKDIRYATGCHCHYGHCDHVDFCAKIQYRRSADMWSGHGDPSKLAVCAKNFHPWEYHYNWSPKGMCNEYNTQVLWDYELAGEWRNFTYRFQADCNNLEVTS